MIHHGDCLEVMAGMEPESVSAIVTDPPYGLGFMGKHWDHGLPGQAFYREMWRIAKPGAHLLAFGGTRTYHRLAAAIEDAGWEIRDCLVWAYASGFPKSLDVSKAIDKAAGAEREIVGTKLGQPGYSLAPSTGTNLYDGSFGGTGDPVRESQVTAPATDTAREWQGWGTALKPAWEPIVMARKPLRGTVAANVQAHGTGALNIDGTRIPGGVAAWETPRGGIWTTDSEATAELVQREGRWPANVILTDPIFDGGIEGVVGGGEAAGSKPFDWRNAADRASFAVGREASVFYDDTGTYSRFFLIPKADRAEREPVLGGLPVQRTAAMQGNLVDGQRLGGNGSPIRTPERANVHPTVKPLDLMRHLVRLVTPPGGLVLDPFLGSGTTGLACEMEGFPWVGIEREEEYVRIAEARLNGTQKGMGI